MAPPHVQWHSYFCQQVRCFEFRLSDLDCDSDFDFDLDVEIKLVLCRTGKYDLEVTTFQMAVLFCWENRSPE